MDQAACIQDIGAHAAKIPEGGKPLHLCYLNRNFYLHDPKAGESADIYAKIFDIV